MSAQEVVRLERDHPGFRDRAYRERRDAIARAAVEAAEGAPAPRVEYTRAEHEVWRRVQRRLAPLHRRRVAGTLVAAADALALDREAIPQLAEVSDRLAAATGFRLVPVAGLIAPRAFLCALADGVFLATQYVRHASRPFYTPEPDVIHELVGHAASLTCPGVAEASRALGRAARAADDEGCREVERVYWHSLEFSAVREGGAVKAFGAGLLSSVDELDRLERAEHRPWDLDALARTAYDPADYQPGYFVAPSTERLLDDVLAWATARAGRGPGGGGAARATPTSWSRMTARKARKASSQVPVAPVELAADVAPPDEAPVRDPAPEAASTRLPATTSLPATTTASPTARFHKIRSLEVEGGFLDGLSTALDPGLNCIIGARGTGKTTVLEFLRYTLRDGQEPRRATRDSRLLKSNLGVNGAIRVGIETRDGVRYTVERSFDRAPQVLNEQGLPAGFSLQHGSVFDIDVYSQNEVEAIAGSPTAQLELIDRFEAPRIHALERDLAAVAHQLDGSAAELTALEASEASLSEAVSERQALRDTLRAHEPTGTDAERVAREVELEGLRDRELRALDGVDRFLVSAAARIRDALAAVEDGRDLVPGDVRAGPNGEPFDALRAALRACAGDVSEHLRAARASLERCEAQARDARARLLAAHVPQQARYREVVVKHEADKGRASERLVVQQKLNQLEERARELGMVEDRLVARRAERAALLARLEALRSDRFALRKQVATRLTDELDVPALKDGRVRVTVSQGEDSSAYRELLGSVLRAGELREPKELVDKLTARVLPHDLVRMAREARRGETELDAQTAELADASGLTTRRAEQVLRLLGERRELYKLETVELRDVPSVQLRVGEVEKPASDLSTGQRCTAILPLLLLESDRPLLIDQPEDNLDNRYIFNTVVDRLKAVKRRRQLIFVTHNPNIPVLGDAAHVIVMDSDGRQARIADQGTVDAMRGHVEEILEGGPEAFAERARRYGHDR